MDVYNDVCANYQYYAYRYTGMLIGSVRENVTIDGRSYPKMDGITASGCTVHFGTWNDYYYCELVANSLASYTHDHQFSRLEQVASVDAEKMQVTTLKGDIIDIPTSGRYNYVVVNGEHATENATCYHFVDGKVHDHDDYNGDGVEDYETVNGESIRVENNRHIYLEFNNLVTGYGWGVTSKAVGDLAGVTILDREVGDSVDKFEAIKSELTNNRKYKLGDIFAYLEDCGVKLVPGALTVTITNLDENGNVSATVEYDRENWENSTISFNNTGNIKITIQDYYFCIPTELTVNITERQPEVKFDVVMNNGDFLHRVGNSGTVALDKLFKAKDGVTVGTISVTVEAVNGTSASGTYSNNAIQFSGTGVVKVSITDNDYCTPTVLNLEVVDAVNATSAMSATSNNVVLLNDIGSGFTVSNGYAFYGNGFKVTCAGLGYRLNYAGMYGGFIEVNNGGVLDNVQVFSDIYPVALLYSSEAKDYKNDDVSTTEKTYYNYQLSAVAITGNGSMITNSYIYGGRNNIYVGDGNVTIANTTTENGVLANIQIKSSNASTVTLKDITTIQNEVVSTYDATQTMLGCGIIVGDVTSVSNPNVVLKGVWNNYNWVTSANASNTSNTYAKEIINKALSVTDYQHTNSNKANTVNLGLIVLNQLAMSIDDQRDVEGNYKLSNITMSLKDPETGFSGDVKGQVYSVIAGKGNPDAIVSEYVPVKNLEYKPTATQDETVAGNKDANDGGDDSRYCYWEGDLLKLMYKEKTTPFTIDVANLVAFKKFGYDLSSTVSVTLNGTKLSLVDGKAMFTDAGSYVIAYTVTDGYNYDKSGNIIAEAVEWTFTYEVEVSLAKAAGKNPEINVATNSFYGAYGKTSSMFDPDFHYCIPFMKDVVITDYAEDGVTASTFNPTSNIVSIEVSGDKTSGTVTIKYLDGRSLVVTTSGHSVGLGSSGNTISVKTYDGQLWICTDGVSNNATTGTWKVTSYKFTGNNGVPVEYTTTRTCNFDSASTSNSPQTGWSSYTNPSVDSIKYTVTFDANGGTCTKTFAYATASSTSITLPTPTRSGYIFAGWFTAASGGTRVGGAGDSYTLTANVTLYAQWGKPCTVTYNANGGSCGTASEKYTGTALTLPTPTRDGYWFIGWYDAAEGGNKIGDAGATYNPSGEITLYAHWQEKIEYTVTYNANGGTCGTASATYQGTALTLPTPTRTGYTFNGWYTAASDGTKIGDAGASYTPSANVTLYAQWEKIAYTITVTTSNATVSGVTNGQTAYYGDEITITVSYTESNSRKTTVNGTQVTLTNNKYTFTVTGDTEINASSSGSCVTGDTLVTLADGTQKRIDELTLDDKVLAWDFFTGSYVAKDLAFLVNHGEAFYQIANLVFSDGTTLRIIGDHGVFDYDLNKYVYFTVNNMQEYVGHRFVQYAADGTYNLVTLVEAYETEEYTSAWSITSVDASNAFASGLLTVGPPADFYNWIEMGDKLMYNVEQFAQDVETYGLYTYDDFKEYLTYEQFVNWNGAYLKIAVEKGYFTFDYILELIEIYGAWMV